MVEVVTKHVTISCMSLAFVDTNKQAFVGRIISIKELSYAQFPCLRRSLESCKIKELAIRPCPNIDSFTEAGSHCFQNCCQVECEESGG